MKYWVAIHRPVGYDAFSQENAAMGREIDELNDAMVEAGVRVFVGGFQPPETARAIRRNDSGSTEVSSGLYRSEGDFVGGFWVLDVADESEALEWGEKAAAACRANVEVRPFH